MKSIALKAFPRSVAKRSGVKKLRSQGRVPAVIYGHTEPKNLEISYQDIKDIIHEHHSELLLLDLSIDGGNHLALVKEIQHHPLNGQILHVDLHEVTQDQKVSISIPVEPVGEAAGVKAGGGVLERVLFKIKVRATPTALPEAIYVDVSHLEIGQSISLGEIKLPPGVEAIGNKEVSVFTVAEPVSEAEELAAAEAAAAAPGAGEVEMIKEKKEGEEEEGAPAKPGEKGAPAKPGEKGAPAKAEAGKPGAAPAGKAGAAAPAAAAAAGKPEAKKEGKKK